MPLSTDGRPPRAQAIDTIHAALDAGVRLVDTADAYCLTDADTGHNEALVADALATWAGPRDEVVVATKGGHVRDAQGGWATDGRPEHLADAARRSRDRLGVDRIRLYQFHRPDPLVPFERSVEAVAQLVDDGVVLDVGFSNVDVAQLEHARSVLTVASVQNEMSPYVPSADVVAWCEAHDVPFLAWAPLGGAGRAARLGEDATTQPFADLARRLGATTAQVVLAWLVARSPVIVPIPGARRPASILASVEAVGLHLPPGDLAALEHAVAG